MTGTHRVTIGPWIPAIRATCLGLVFLIFPLRTPADDFSNGIHEYLQQRVAIGKFDIGIVVGLVDERGSRIVACGKLDNGTDREVDGDTLFEVGSVTKTFTGLLLQDMVDRRKMKLGDPARKYLPRSVTMPTRNGKQITLIELATHTSGLPKIPDNLDPRDAENPYVNYTVEQMYDFLSRCKSPQNGKTEWRYSNLGMGLLGHVMTRTAGTNYEALVVDRICNPLKMDSTRITLTPELKSRFATPHNPIGDAVPSWELPALTGAGGLYSTVNDLLKYVSANLGLTPSALTPLMEETHAIHFDQPNVRRMGLAWFNATTPNGTKIIFHDGGSAGSCAFVGFDKARRRGVVVLSNSQGVFNLRNVGRILLENEWQSGANIADKLPKDPEPPKRPITVQLDAKLLDACVGRYEFAPSDLLRGGVNVRIWRESDQLLWQAQGEDIIPHVLKIFPESETNFFVKVSGARLTFVKDRNGVVTAVRHHSATVPGMEGRKHADQQGEAEMTLGIPDRTDDGWETSSLSGANIDAGAVKVFFEALEKRNYTNIHSVLLVRSNKLVLERYFPGNDWGGKPQTYDRETAHTVQSVTKGVNAILTGIAIDLRLIPSVDEKISSFFPEHAALFSDSGKKNIRVKNLLSMTAGISWDERTHSYTDGGNDNVRMNQTNDPVRFVLERPMATKPGAKYVYNSGNAILLGEIIRKASGMSVDQFAETNLFKPLGMSAYTWKGPFTNGVVHTGGGLFLRPRDMAKIGSLVLNQGRWQGRQIVSEKFIRALTTKQAPDFEYAGPVYGYEWKLCTVTNSNRKITFFVSDGYAGQYILAFPGQDLVVVSTAWTMSPAWNFINPLLESILPAVHGDAYQIAKQKN